MKIFKTLSSAEAAKLVHSGSNIYVHSVAQFPKILINSLADRARNGDLHGIVLHHLHTETQQNPFDTDELCDKGTSHHFFIGKNARKAVADGHGAYIPTFLSDIPALLRRRQVPLDFALLNVSPPDKHGYCSLGTEVCAALPAAQSAAKVIAQINPNVPRTHGNSALHISSFDYVVEVDGNDDNAKIPTVSVAEPSPQEWEIGKILAGMIPDGATLQVGIGSIPNAVLASLKNHKNLGIHSEMISDGAMDLIKCGAVNNIAKDLLSGKTVTSFIVGTRDLYDFVDDNPGFHFDDASFTNHPPTIAKNKKVVAINSALQVDLSGQVCADSIGTRMISGVGGQLDFETGAAMSEGGIPVICLTARNGKTGQPSIVNCFKPGSGVTTTRYNTHWVVTEYGAVNLWGKDLQERARLLIGISHPDDREDLIKAAYERYKVHIKI